MRHLILRLNRQHGMTVILSSHLLSEVEQVCDRIAVLNQGRMIFEGNWKDLTGDGLRYRLEAEPWDAAAGLIAGCVGWNVSPERIVSAPAGHDIADLVAALVQAGIKIRAVEPLKQNLEEIYLDMVGNKAEAGES
jgi:ABC-type multidrug transport system ATPase subunit